MEIALDNIRQSEGILDNLNSVKEKIENRLNLSTRPNNEKRIILTGNKIMRLCLIAGLSLAQVRCIHYIDSIQLSKSSIRILSSFFRLNLLKLFSPKYFVFFLIEFNSISNLFL